METIKELKSDITLWRNLSAIQAFLIIATFFTSCSMERYEKHKSELLQERGVVVAKQYKGKVNESVSHMGFTMSGEMTYGTASIREKERFDVVFKCDHGNGIVI